MGYTEQMEDKLFQPWDELDEYNEDYQALIESINKADFFRSFGEGLIFFLQKKIPDFTAESALRYIEILCAEAGISKSDIASTNTLKSWFNSGPRPKKGEDSRSSIFALAFALRLTPEETADLFHKVYLDRAFDYRNANEIIYYFCLQHQKSWTDANRLIDTLGNISVDVSDHTVYTAEIRTDIDSLIDENALLAYIANHGRNMGKKSISAKKIVKELTEKAKEIAEKETKLIASRTQAEEAKKSKDAMYANSPEIEHFRNTDAKSLNHLYEVITGCTVRGAKGTKTRFKNSRLPKEIKSRFPEAGTLSKKDPTYEELRKLIILLASYNFWYRMQENDEGVDIEDYIADLNVYLDESGLSLIYFGNPYDWLFLYCTLAKRPLDTFRGILAEVLDEE